MKVIICGTENTDIYPRIYPELYNVVDDSLADAGVMWGGINMCQLGWNNIFKNYCGVEFEMVLDSDILENEEYKAMEVWPGVNSVKLIDDVMVVKLSNNL